MTSYHVSNTYGQMLFKVTEEEDKTIEVLYELKKLQEEVGIELSNILDRELISKHDKNKVLDELQTLGTNKLIINLLKILVMRKHTKYFSQIIKKFEQCFLDKENIKIINIATSKKLVSNNYDYLVKELEKKTQKFIVIKPLVDEKLIGGIKIEYDGKLIDNTIKKHLRDLKSQTLGV